MGSSKVENEPVGKTLPRDRYHLLSRICDQLKPGHSLLRHRRSVSERAVWSDRVVLLPPPVVSVVGDGDPTCCLATLLPPVTATSTCRSFRTICSGLCAFPGISASLQNVQYLIFQLDTFEGGRSHWLCRGRRTARSGQEGRHTG